MSRVHRKFVGSTLQNKGSRVEKILIIVVESGLGYYELGVRTLVLSITIHPNEIVR